MAIRFNIDKYNLVREKYLQSLRGETLIDVKFYPLIEIYKPYWQNDPEVKEAEKEHKAKKSIQINSPSITAKETNKKGKLSSEQRITAKIEKIHSQWGNNAQSTRNDAHGNFIIMRQRSKTHEKETDRCISLSAGLTIHIDNYGNCTDFNKVRRFVSCAKSNLVLERIRSNLRCKFRSQLINLRSYEKICNVLHRQDLILKIAQRRREIAASGQSHCYTEHQQLSTLKMYRLVNERKDKPIKHYSVWAYSGGLPSLGKRR